MKIKKINANPEARITINVIRQIFYLISMFFWYFVPQSTFNMSNPARDLETLQDIKRIMERSSRFISLSGWSGISAGICGLLGAGIAHHRIRSYYGTEHPSGTPDPSDLINDLIVIALITFVISFIFAIVFTYLRSKKENVAIWGATARRLMWNTCLPLFAGGCLLWRMIDLNQYDLIAPTSLIFYGLALINGSKYTMGEVRWLGYGEMLLGLLNLWILRSELLFWAVGFGLLHIVYGIAMWWKYERKMKVGKYSSEINAE